MKSYWLLVVFCIMTGGCAGNPASWSSVSGRQVEDHDRIELDWPAGWMKYIPADKDEKAKKEGLVLFVTRDGNGLQRIMLKRTALEQGFAYTQKKASAAMLPQELADIIMDDIRANANIIDPQLLENRPSELGGIPGFRLLLTYKTKAGLPKQLAYYGCLADGHMYGLVYDAPRRHYFELDLSTFESVHKSFKWKTAGVSHVTKATE